MKKCGTIQCSAEQAVPLIIGKDTVYIHTNIIKLMEDSMGNPIDNLYSCHEVQYDKDEYIQVLAEKSENLTIAITEMMGV